MMTTGAIQKPRVFVSSTIRDFIDLRSALKFWLEELGFEPQLSEHNDFSTRPELGAFELCFDNIRESDYYVLLIGYNKGSPFSETPEFVSVTQQEYRVALTSFETTGRPRIISFVREGVFTEMRVRSEIGKFSVDGSNRPTLQDPDFTAKFIREVSREQEVSAAVATGTGYPTANWVSHFNSFRDLTDTLKSALRIKGTLHRAAIVENLRHELERNLGKFIHKVHGRPLYNHLWLNQTRQQIPLRYSGYGATVNINNEQLQNISIYLLAGTVNPDHILVIAQSEAIMSGSMLDYDRIQNLFVASPLLGAIYKLREELVLYTRRYEVVGSALEWHQRWQTLKNSLVGSMEVSETELAQVFALYDTQQNIVRITVGILRHLYGHTTDIEFHLRPASPFLGIDSRLQDQNASEEELRTWLRSDNILLRLGLTDQTEEERRIAKEQWQTLEELIGKDGVDSIINKILGRDPEE